MERRFIEYTDGRAVFEGYLARQTSLAPCAPCVVLAHEWSGLNEAMRRCADRIASLGYVCFATDVYGKGIRGDQLGDNSCLMNPLLSDRALLRQRLLAGLDAARALPGVDPALCEFDISLVCASYTPYPRGNP